MIRTLNKNDVKPSELKAQSGDFGIFSQKGLNKAVRLKPRFCEGKRDFAENRPSPSRKLQPQHSSQGGKRPSNRRQSVGRKPQACGNGF